MRGHTVDCKTCLAVELLRAECNKVLSDNTLVTQDITGDGKPETFCNWAAQRISMAMGCWDFRHQIDTAARMVEIMKEKWRLLDSPKAAHYRALHGGELVIAGAGNHVAVIYPAPMQLSPSLGVWVPMVANVGKTNGLMRVSSAFPVAKGLPDFFVWQGNTRS